MIQRRTKYFLRLIVAIAVIGNCTPRPTPIPIGSLTIDCPPDLITESLNQTAMKTRLIDAVSMSENFSMPVKQRHLSRVMGRLHVSLIPPRTHNLPLEVGVRLTLNDDLNLGREAVAQTRIFLLEPTSGALFEGLAEAIPNSLAQLAVHWKQHTSSSKALLDDLSAADSWRREGAARALSRRDLPHLIPTLVDHLKRDPDPSCQIALISALVAQRAQLAVPDVIEAMQRKEPSFVAPLTYALAALGGRMAEGYLTNLAAGHASQSVRESAQDALGYLVAALAKGSAIDNEK